MVCACLTNNIEGNDWETKEAKGRRGGDKNSPCLLLSSLLPPLPPIPPFPQSTHPFIYFFFFKI